MRKIGNGKREITTDTKEIQRTIQNYYEQIYAKKLDDLGEMYKFLEKYKILKLNQEEAESLNRPITAGEIGTVIKKFLAHKSPEPDGFTEEF